MPRQLDALERQRFKAFFPNLDVDRAVVTGEGSTVYNCIAWTVGMTHRWIWPGNALADFDAFYYRFGIVRSGDGNIAAWGLSATDFQRRTETWWNKQ
ncbi:MAG TPA: hypothetical protein VF278_09360 [Pirellulales bacterium]